MPIFLHEPLIDPDRIRTLVSNRAPETQHLEFKQEWWSDKQDKKTGFVKVPAAEELASDVAAFLNAEGGDILLGITDREGRAAGWFPADKINYMGRQQDLLDALSERLEPREAAGNVVVHDVVVDDGGVRHPVLIVNIAPWPHGMVGVLRRQKQGSKRSDRIYHLFPARDGSGTRYLEMGEVMRFSDPRTRSTFLKISNLLQGRERPPVYFTSGLWIDLNGTRSRVGWAASHAVVVAMDNQGLTLEMQCMDAVMESTARAVATARTDLWWRQDAHPALKAIDAAQSAERIKEQLQAEPGTQALFGGPLAVPLTFIEEVWLPEAKADVLHMALKVHPVWLGDGWVLETK
jgi:hypothetical protein